MRRAPSDAHLARFAAAAGTAAVRDAAFSRLPRETLRLLGPRDGFPPLPHYEVELRRAHGAAPSPVADALAQHILDTFNIANADAA